MPKRVPRSLGFLVDNEFGVLTRITALVRREGMNIKSLAVTDTKKPELSHMIISVECIESRLNQIIERLQKLNCIKKVVVLDDSFDLGITLNEIFSAIPGFEEALTTDGRS